MKKSRGRRQATQARTWTAIWIRGELKATPRLWGDWADAILRFANTSSIAISHVGAASATSFHSGKYMSFRHVRKRLQAALASGEAFESLDFISVQPPIITMIQDQRFGACLSIHTHPEVLIVFQDEHFAESVFADAEKMALPLFSAGRCERFRVSRDDLPMNYLISFGKANARIPRGFVSLGVRAV